MYTITPNLIGLQKSAGLFDGDNMTLEEALEKIVNHPNGLRAAAKYLDNAAEQGNNALKDAVNTSKDKAPATLGAILGMLGGSGAGAYISAKNKFGIPASVAAMLGGHILGGVGGGFAGQAIGDQIKSASAKITSNLFGLSSALGLEKQAARLLRNSIKHLNPTPSTIRSMQKVVANAPRGAGGALSPTSMVDYVTRNYKNLPGFGAELGTPLPGANSFAAAAYSKAKRLKDKASAAWNRYSNRIRTGEVDALDPATLKRMDQLQGRVSSLNNAKWNISDNLDDLTRMNPYNNFIA